MFPGRLTSITKMASFVRAYTTIPKPTQYPFNAAAHYEAHMASVPGKLLALGGSSILGMYALKAFTDSKWGKSLVGAVIDATIADQLKIVESRTSTPMKDILSNSIPEEITQTPEIKE